jgi:quercetin dioxygenase-like cupin family protein
MKKIRVVCLWVLLAGVSALGTHVFGQEKVDAAAHKIVRFADLKWTPIIKGCELAPVSGDPNGDGTPFVVRVRCQDGSKIPAHWHPTDENVTVLKGAFLVGMGDVFDESKLQTMNVGNFIAIAKEMRHFAASKGETIVQVHGAGPFKVNWVNPAEVEPADAAAKPKILKRCEKFRSGTPGARECDRAIRTRT